MATSSSAEVLSADGETGAQPKADMMSNEQASAEIARKPSQGVDLLKTPDGEVAGLAIGPVAQCHALLERFLASPMILAFPTAQRYSIAGHFAAIPEDERPRIVERLLAGVSSSPTEAGALNALYLLQTCSELVPNFSKVVPAERLTSAADLCAHGRVKAAILQDQKPEEWEKVENQQAGTQYVLLQGEEPGVLDEARDILAKAGVTMAYGAKRMSGAAFGSIGALSDGLGLTTDAQQGLRQTAEGTVDLVGQTVDSAVDEVAQRGVLNTVSGAAVDTAYMVTEFVEDTVSDIANGIWSMLDWREDEKQLAMHKVLIQVKELFGEERSLGLRLEDRVVTHFTKPEAEKIGWQLGDLIIGMKSGPVASQEDLLTGIADAKEVLKSQGTPMTFLVQRLGPKPNPKVASKVGDLVFVQGRAARVKQVDLAAGEMICEVQDDCSLVRIAIPLQ